MSVAGPIFSVQPWREEFGDPARPLSVVGVGVESCLLRRSDEPGVLIRMVDHRYALTGPVLIVGPARQLVLHLRRRAARAPSAQERQWLSSVCDALARRSPEYRTSQRER